MRCNFRLTSGMASLRRVAPSPFFTVQQQRRSFSANTAHEPPSSSSSSGSQQQQEKRGPRSRSELLGLIAGCSVFPMAVMWMTRNDNNNKKENEAVGTSPAKTQREPIGSDGPSFGKMEVTTIPKPQLGGPFRLFSSRTGQEVTDQEVFLGKWTLLYFGFSKCAEICPNTLKFISELMAESDARYGNSAKNDAATVKEANKLQSVFLSIDFLRDTPATVQNFLEPYDVPKKRILGLSGSRAQVEEAARNWRVYFSSYDESEEERLSREAKGVALPELDDSYQFDHSSAIYLVGPDGKMKDFYFREIGVANTVDRLGLHYQDAYGING
ncbi:cytochrome c oxidase assembly factor, putative [Bodo saltans]|uniref:Cytochrome c oxidase assembly factor, putative n=1 Tax=Bodo saltans TaxID=75058 RepID=A0A0S4KH84_BODSA|nr:cytochrome c oxidase assembly factor, putative [Bodo saltans]|eukprot:CUI15050.1 cytochrome c oxidase assembly factor, putative [Bodo saltans]